MYIEKSILHVERCKSLETLEFETYEIHTRPIHANCVTEFSDHAKIKTESLSSPVFHKEQVYRNLEQGDQYINQTRGSLNTVVFVLLLIYRCKSRSLI